MRFLLLLLMVLFSGCSTKTIWNENNTYWNRVALIIGNQDYRFNTRLKAPLVATEKLKATLLNIGFKNENICILKNATFEKLDNKFKVIKKIIEKNKLKTKTKTIFYIYFAGHGHTEQNRTAEVFLEMIDSTERVFISNYYLYDQIIDIGAEYNVISVDACLNLVSSRKDKSKKIFGESNMIPDNLILSFATGFTEKTKDEGIYLQELNKGLLKKEAVQTIFNHIEKVTKKELNTMPFRLSTMTDPITLGVVYHSGPPITPR